jgi:zinc/manganese transport system substrate-binding protein
LRITAPSRRRLRAGVAAALALVALALVAACGSDDGEGDRPAIAVTTPVLGSLVGDLVGDAAEVRVIMPGGADPHEFQPSAKDAEALTSADLVVENGLGLEEGLEDSLARVRDDGVPVFTVTDHATLREVGEDEAAGGEHGEEDHGAQDPHVWMDPLAMSEAMAALAPVVERELGIDVSARAADLDARLQTLNAELEDSLATIPQDRRRLVTGHESMGYFADRYGFEVTGALVPSLSTQAQASASALATLRDQVRAQGVPAIFNEIGTPDGVAEAIADETGARVVDVPTHALPDDGSYFTFMREVAAAVTDGLGGQAAR